MPLETKSRLRTPFARGLDLSPAKISLPLRQHKLRLLFADEAHVPHDPPVYSNVITVTVTPTGRRPLPRPHRPPHHGYF
jgi:Domain of unknown function (DUF4399)